MTEVRLIDAEHGPRVVNLALEGRTLSRRYGRLDAALELEHREYERVDEAEKAMSDAITRLRRSGYTIVGERASLLAAIEREPECIDHYLVYADWLITHDNPHGDLIQLMIAASEQPRDPNLTRAITRLQLEHRHVFQPWTWRALTLEWRWGFVSGVEFGRGTPVPQLELGERVTLLDAHTDRRTPMYPLRPPEPRWPNVELGLRLQSLRRHPCGRALRRLRNQSSQYEIQVDGPTLSLVRLV